MGDLSGFVRKTSRDAQGRVSTHNMKIFTAYIEYDRETKLYVGIVPGITGAHTQAETLDELPQNLKEVLELCLEEYRENLEDLPHFIGVQQIEVGV